MASSAHAAGGWACVAEQERSEILSRLEACLNSQAGSPDLRQRGDYLRHLSYLRNEQFYIISICRFAAFQYKPTLCHLSHPHILANTSSKGERCFVLKIPRHKRVGGDEVTVISYSTSSSSCLHEEAKDRISVPISTKQWPSRSSHSR